MRCYLSGWQATTRERETKVIQAGGLQYRCFSFAAVAKVPGLFYSANTEGAYEACVEHKIGIMMDSGVFSWRNFRDAALRRGDKKALGKLVDEPSFIQMYVDYVKANRTKWDFYVTVDLEKHCARNFERHSKLEKLGIRPVPVFHGDDSLDYLRRYADKGYRFIAIGWMKGHSQQSRFRQYLDGVFDLAERLKLRLHGLAMTAPWQLLGYPWWSIDSSSWSRVAGYGGIMRFEEHRQRLSIMHVSVRYSKGKGAEVKQNSRMMDIIKRELEVEGYDFEQLRTDFVLRHIYNAATMRKMAEAAERKNRTGWNLLF